ncbi:MAG: aldehyde dehydrogenase (NADP(+)) [Bacteroidota bacterium]
MNESNTPLYGQNFLGFKRSALMSKLMHAMNPATQQLIEGAFNVASPEEIDEAMQLATKAAHPFAQTSNAERAAFLNAIADEILALGDALVQRAMAESGLPEGRIIGERGRTMNQLRLFAKVVKEGSWVEASIDLAQPERTPFPKADIRKMLVPVGPVVVFTASNFPLAFSTAGGDTASALAAGCPVVVKAHESHLGTNALVAYAIQNAAQKTGMPDGVFSSLNGTGPELGQALAKHSLTKSIAFTGSLRAGKALYDAAANRPDPIPVFAEMGSINPVVLLPDALQQRAGELAKTYAGSVTLGVGQFCTNPGLILGVQSEALDRFVDTLAAEIKNIAPATMLNEGVCNNYQKGLSTFVQMDGVQLEGESQTAAAAVQGKPVVCSTKGAYFMDHPTLHEEVFGPSTLVVRCADNTELLSVVQELEGQLTGTIMGESKELADYPELIAALQQKVGRLIFNSVPTGVEVCDSMQHGGPWPATTDSRFTSVGTGAIRRFARPVTWQSWPQALLPDALKDDNPLNIWRKLDGEWKQ